MKIRYLIIYILIFIAFGTLICLKIARGNDTAGLQAKTTEINRLLISIEDNWQEISANADTNKLELTDKVEGMDYAVIDNDMEVLLITRNDISRSVSSATTNYDIIRDIEVEGEVVGKLIIHNPSSEIMKERNERYACLVALMLLISLILIVIYSIYIKQRVIAPFSRMKSFAVRIAAGDLDTPLEMDRGHIFGEFTEAFDIMREELKSSKEREEAAVKSRKELVAELSHDIKTPVASIKAVADVMSLTELDEEQREAIASINGKADQIDSLISNLFHATLEELEHLEVKIEEITSTDICHMIREADYQNRTVELDIKEAVIYGDKLRINQIITNIISNSYKYAGTDISVDSYFEEEDYAEVPYEEVQKIEIDGVSLVKNKKRSYLVINISDKGGGVPETEIEMITEKFKRGSNSEGKDGAGLGLYISKYLMEKMGGSMNCHNTREGLEVTLRLLIS